MASSLTDITTNAWKKLDRLQGEIPPGDYFRLLGCFSQLLSSGNGVCISDAKSLLGELKIRVNHPDYFTRWSKNLDYERIKEIERNFFDVIEILGILVYTDYL